MDKIMNFLEKEIMSIPCLDLFGLRDCIEKLLTSSPPLAIAVGYFDRRLPNGESRDDSEDLTSSSSGLIGAVIMNNNGHSANGRRGSGVGISVKNFQNEQRWKSVLFHEILHRCEPKISELEIEIIEAYCMPGDVFEKNEALNPRPVIYRPVDKGMRWISSENGQPQAMKVRDKWGRVKVVLVYGNRIILDPETGDVYHNRGTESLPLLGRKLIEGSPFKIDLDKILKWLDALDGQHVWEMPLDNKPKRVFGRDLEPIGGLEFVRSGADTV